MNINYKTSFYADVNPYRQYLYKALKYFNKLEFTGTEEFWTLGAVEWHEFEWLIKRIKFLDEAVYCNVDRGNLQLRDYPHTRAYSKTEFFDIARLWKNPVILSYDSIIGLVENNAGEWGSLVDLAMKAVALSGEVLLNFNFMAGYAHTSEYNWEEVYESWLCQLNSNVDCFGYNIEYYPDCVCDTKYKSPTPMISGHCRIFS